MFAERPTWIEIDLQALAGNYAALRAFVGSQVKIVPALKGNAYGHGAGLVGSCLAKCDIEALTVGSLDDALAIRHASADVPVLLFGGPIPDGLPAVLDQGFTPTIYNMASAEAVSAWARTPTDVIIKVDSGLGRLGVSLDDALAFVQAVGQLPNVRIAGVYTHLTFHDATEMAWARERLEAFDGFLDELGRAGIALPMTQALASTGILAGLSSRANTICPGSMLYGMCPIDPDLCDFSPFTPVLRAIKSKLIHIREEPDTRVGVVPLGVADGFRRAPSGAKVDVLICGQRARVLGTSLEYTNIDLTGIENATLGDEAVFVGTSGTERITLAELGTHWGTGELHTLMSFAGHLPRVAV